MMTLRGVNLFKSKSFGSASVNSPSPSTFIVKSCRMNFQVRARITKQHGTASHQCLVNKNTKGANRMVGDIPFWHKTRMRHPQGAKAKANKNIKAFRPYCLPPIHTGTWTAWGWTANRIAAMNAGAVRPKAR